MTSFSTKALSSSPSVWEMNPSNCGALWFQSLSCSTIRIVRVTGPLLLFAESLHFSIDDKLIPFGIALLWYSSSDPAKVKYKDTPFGGMNLLPCTISPRGGQNNYFIIEFRGGRNIRITVFVSPRMRSRTKREGRCWTSSRQCPPCIRAT